MKKILIILATVIVLLSIAKEDKIIIPKDSIRFRVIANSDSLEDQKIKRKVVSALKVKIEDWYFYNDSLASTRNKIKKELPTFEEIVEKTLATTAYNDNYQINYGMNYFPRKEYKGVVYEEGNYESLVVTIGDGLGKNFWCVLFPPLCKIDEETEEVEYKSLIKEILNKYL